MDMAKRHHPSINLDMVQFTKWLTNHSPEISLVVSTCGHQMGRIRVVSGIYTGHSHNQPSNSPK